MKTQTIRDYGVGVLGAGHYLPEHMESNEELCKTLEGVTPEWIENKTGIKRRYIAKEGQTASNMALRASLRAIENAGIDVKQIGLIISCTFSHDYQFPALSTKMHKELKTLNATTFDLQANCAGFVTGLTVASDRMFMDDTIEYALVIGVELHTIFRNNTDKEVAIFFSDGAGAAILGKVKKDKGIINSYFHADSSTYDSVRLRGGGSAFPFNGQQMDPLIGFMEMNGLATWKQAITNLPISVRRACERAEVHLDEIDFVLFHQANLAMIQYVMKKMKLPLDKTFTNVQEIGNTGSASVAIALSEAMELGKIKENDLVVLSAVGAGFIFGTNVWKW
jgi:3-oxoacyl-[acyl-carrier-protein] synthase-3